MTSIEPLTPEHFSQVAGWLSRPEINQWLNGEWRGTAATTTIVAVAVRNRRNRLFLVRSDDEACGLVALADVDTSDHIAMVWYVLGDTRFAGRGVTTDAVRVLTGLAFNELGLRSLYAWVMERNVASRRILEKCGFREVGCIRQAACHVGRQTDRIYFDLLPEDRSKVHGDSNP